MEPCSKDKKNPSPILLMKDLDKARTNLYDEIHKFHTKWLNNYKKFLELHLSSCDNLRKKDEEKNKDVIDKFDKLRDDKVKNSTSLSELKKIMRDRDSCGKYSEAFDLINSGIKELYLEPSSKFYYDFLDDAKTDAAIKFIEAKYKEIDNLKAMYKKARTKLKNYMDEQVKDLISYFTSDLDETINSLNPLVDCLRFKMLNEIKKVVKDKLGFKGLIKDGAENSEIIKELKQKIKNKVDELKKKQEENSKEVDNLTSDLAHDLASKLTDKIFEAWKEKNEQQ